MESRRDAWNDRYRSKELVWGAEPNRFVREEFATLPPGGRALDLACGEGRNALWLAERGWEVTAVDFSPVALSRARSLAADRKVPVDFVEADVTTWRPEPGAYALVLVAYLQVPPSDRVRVWSRLAEALAPGGVAFLVGHALRNLAEGVGGPQRPEVLWDPPQIAAELEAAGLAVISAEEVRRPVADAGADAIDARIRAQRPGPERS
jgi:SAM-dependent methyltransferase